MFSYMVGECANYICSKPPLWCTIGDIIFICLVIGMLISLIYQINKKDKKESAD